MLEELRANRSSASQPKFVVCYVTDRTPLENGPETFGFGVSLSLSIQQRDKKETFRTPAEFVCSEAFRNFEVRSTKNNDVLNFFLPLWLSDTHWQIAKKEGPNGYLGFFELCKKMWDAPKSPFRSEKPEPAPAVIAARLLCRILSNMVADEISRGINTEIDPNEQLQRATSANEPLSDACPSSCDHFGMMSSSLKGNTSDCFISGYFSILRLLKVLARENSNVVEYANEAWKEFVNKSKSRCRCPSIGDLLVLLCITQDDINWDFVKKAFLDEFYRRLVKWCVAFQIVINETVIFMQVPDQP